MLLIKQVLNLLNVFIYLTYYTLKSISTCKNRRQAIRKWICVLFVKTVYNCILIKFQTLTIILIRSCIRNTIDYMFI